MFVAVDVCIYVYIEHDNYVYNYVALRYCYALKDRQSSLNHKAIFVFIDCCYNAAKAVRLMCVQSINTLFGID